jgi:hypothetical protein
MSLPDFNFPESKVLIIITGNCLGDFNRHTIRLTGYIGGTMVMRRSDDGLIPVSLARLPLLPIPVVRTFKLSCLDFIHR